MSAAHLVLLALLLRSEPALGLRCFACVELQDKPLECPVTSCEHPGGGVCYQGNVMATMGSEGDAKAQVRGCSSTCPAASHAFQRALAAFSALPLQQGLSVQVQGVRCCDADLCNAGAGAGAGLCALGLGLLLSLGPGLCALP